MHQSRYSKMHYLVVVMMLQENKSSVNEEIFITLIGIDKVYFITL